jgi:hypothetical protein
LIAWIASFSASLWISDIGLLLRELRCDFTQSIPAGFGGDASVSPDLRLQKPRDGRRAIADMLVLVHLRCLEYQAGIRRGVSWSIPPDALEIVGVGDDHTRLLNRIEYTFHKIL